MANNVELKFPDSEDLLSQIRFETNRGQIWLSEQRMLLVHSAVMGILRKELIETLGIARTQAFLTRFGYHSGWMDAELVSKVRPDLTKREAYFVGPQLHGIKGMVNVKPVKLDFDFETGKFDCEMDWFNSYEAEVHLQKFGLSDHPICWTLLGYASGYSTFYMGQNIMFKETQCVGCGDDHCHIVGKPTEEWDDHAEIENMFLPDPIADELFSLQSELSKLRESFYASNDNEGLLTNSIGQSEAFLKVCELIRKASHSKVTVLLQGETGVGKEIVAKGLHLSSDRAEKPFVAVNCACIPPELIEAELFGVEKGAYTGATESRQGKFERAHEGTIFLDEVAELSPRAQATLLRVLQEQELERVGDTKTRKVDVRVVAASNEALSDAVDKGKFRADLFYRLNVFPVYIPSLRERTEDIPLLISYFVAKYNSLYNKGVLGVSDMAMQSLLDYKWPGNIRELENMIERGVILADNNHTIDMEAFFPSFSEPSHPLNRITGSEAVTIARNMSKPGEEQEYSKTFTHLLSEGMSFAELEAQLVSDAMKKANGNVTKAAEYLGMTRSQVSHRLKKRDQN